MSTLRALVFSVLIYAFVVAGFAAMSVVVGLVAHWVVPAIDVGAGALLGALSLVVARRVIAAVMDALNPADDDQEPRRTIFVVPPLRPPRRRRVATPKATSPG